MNTIDYLKKFFAEENATQAAIPGLGVFYAETDKNDKMYILFKEVAPKSKDFITYVAFKENITEQETVAELEAWVKEILKSLKSLKVATLPGIGTFEVKDSKVIFMPSADQNIEERFGLESEENTTEPINNNEFQVGPDPEISEEAVLRKKESKVKRRIESWVWIVASGCLVIAIVSCCVFVKPINSVVVGMFGSTESSPVEEIVLEGDLNEMESQDLKMENDLSIEEEDAAIEQSVRADMESKKISKTQSVKTTPAAKKVTPAAKTKTEPTKVKDLAQGVSVPEKGVFYIIVGSYANLDNALRAKSGVEENPIFNTRVLFDANRDIYKVSLKSFKDRESAMKFRNDVRAKGIDGWIFEQK